MDTATRAAAARPPPGSDPRHPYPRSSPARAGTGAHSYPARRSWWSPPVPARVRCPSALCSWEPERPGAVQQLAEFLSSFLQKSQRKLSAPVGRPRLGLRQRPPARRPPLLPRRPAFVLLPHPALEPGRNSRIPLRPWGAAGARPLSGPSQRCPRVPARVRADEPGAPRSPPPLPQPRSPPPPPRPCVRSGPAAARSLPAAGGLPPSLGELGAGRRACAAGPHPRGAGGWELESFLSPGLAPLPARPPPPPGWKASSHLRGVSGWPPGRLVGLHAERRDGSATCAHHA